MSLLYRRESSLVLSYLEGDWQKYPVVGSCADPMSCVFPMRRENQKLTPSLATPNHLYQVPNTSHFTATETHFRPDQEVRKLRLEEAPSKKKQKGVSMQMLLQFQKSRSSFPYLFRIHLQLIQALRQLAAGKRPLPPTINHLASVRDYRFHNAARRLPKKTPMCPSTQRASRASKKFFFFLLPRRNRAKHTGAYSPCASFPQVLRDNPSGPAYYLLPWTFRLLQQQQQWPI